MEHRKQILTWRCGPCDRWVALEVEPGASPKCPACGTEKNPPQPDLGPLARDSKDPRWRRDRPA